MWWLGAILSMLGKSFTNFGINCHKLSAMKESEVLDKRPYYKQPTWFAGLLMMIFGALGDFAALAFTAQSVVAPIGASTLVVNIFFAHFWLGEELKRCHLTGCLLICIGSVLAVCLGSRAEQTMSAKDLSGYFFRPPFIIYVLFTATVVVACKIYLRKCERLHAKILDIERDIKSKTPGVILEKDETFVAAKEEYKPYLRRHPVYFCVLSGTLGGQSLIFAKCVAELMKSTFRGSNQLIEPLFYIVLICMIFFVVSQVHFLNKALILCDALLVVPIFQCTFLTFSVTGGLVYYQEYISFRTKNWIGVSAGVMIILSGIWTLTRDSAKDVEIVFVPDVESESLADRPSSTDIHPLNEINRKDPGMVIEMWDETDGSDTAILHHKRIKSAPSPIHVAYNSPTPSPRIGRGAFGKRFASVSPQREFIFRIRAGSSTANSPRESFLGAVGDPFLGAMLAISNSPRNLSEDHRNPQHRRKRFIQSRPKVICSISVRENDTGGSRMPMSSEEDSSNFLTPPQYYR